MSPNDEIRLASIVWLDRRALIAEAMGAGALFFSVLVFAVIFTGLVVEFDLESFGWIIGLSLMGLSVCLAIAWFVVWSIGGSRVEVSDVLVDLSGRTVRIKGGRDIRKADVVKAKVRRVRGGCVDVALKLHSGGAIRITPVAEAGASYAERQAFCRRCEMIRDLFLPGP